MKNELLIYFISFLLFISVMCILLLLWRGFRWMFSKKVNSDTYNDTGTVFSLMWGSFIFAAFLFYTSQ